MNPAEWKKFQFITIVQSCVLANAFNKSQSAKANELRHIFSASGVYMTMDDAFWAAEHIPEDLDASRAANDFISYALKLDEGAELPYWAARR